MVDAKVYSVMTPTSRRGPFTSILCPVDFSAHSRAALRYAAAMATQSGGKVAALFVNDPLLVSAAAAAYDERRLVSQSRLELERFVARALGARGATVTCDAVVGEPASHIQRYAKANGVDLIVLGSEGLGGARRLFFGSTTARVLSESGVPVLAVPPVDRRSKAIARRWPNGPILAAIDLGRDAARDVAAAAAVADWFDTPLSLVHVVERTRVPAWLSLRPAGHDRERSTQARRRLDALARAHGSIGTIGVHVLVGEPAEQIASLAQDLSAALLVVTLRGDHRLFGDRKGATTYRVVQEAGTPILALPSGWRAPA